MVHVIFFSLFFFFGIHSGTCYLIFSSFFSLMLLQVVVIRYGPHHLHITFRKGFGQNRIAIGDALVPSFSTNVAFLYSPCLFLSKVTLTNSGFSNCLTFYLPIFFLLLIIIIIISCTYTFNIWYFYLLIIVKLLLLKI